MLVAIDSTIHPTNSWGMPGMPERQVEVQTILNAVHQYAVEENRLPYPVNGKRDLSGTGAVCTGGMIFRSRCRTILLHIPGDRRQPARAPCIRFSGLPQAG